MARRNTRNGAAQQRVYGGTTPQPTDEQQGGWSRQQREEMDQRFTDAMARALRTGQAEKLGAHWVTARPDLPQGLLIPGA